MSLVKDIKASVGEGDRLTEQPPAANLMEEPGEIIYFLLYDLR